MGRPPRGAGWASCAAGAEAVPSLPRPARPGSNCRRLRPRPPASRPAGPPAPIQGASPPLSPPRSTARQAPSFPPSLQPAGLRGRQSGPPAMHSAQPAPPAPAEPRRGGGHVPRVPLYGAAPPFPVLGLDCRGWGTASRTPSSHLRVTPRSPRRSGLSSSPASLPPRAAPRVYSRPRRRPHPRPRPRRPSASRVTCSRFSPPPRSPPRPPPLLLRPRPRPPPPLWTQQF